MSKAKNTISGMTTAEFEETVEKLRNHYDNFRNRDHHPIRYFEEELPNRRNYSKIAEAKEQSI